MKNRGNSGRFDFGGNGMNEVNKTLYIPLYGKAYVSKKGIILCDTKAEEIWDKEGFDLKGKSKSKWLAYYMGMRSAVFDDWLKEQMQKDEHAIVVHIGSFVQIGMPPRLPAHDQCMLSHDISACSAT